jgi:hypothetical protein
MFRIVSAAALAALLFAAPAQAAKGDGACIYGGIGQDRWDRMKAKYADPLEGLSHLGEFVSETEWETAERRCLGPNPTPARTDAARSAAAGYALETHAESLLTAAGFTRPQLDAAYRRRDQKILAALARALTESTKPAAEAQTELVAFVKDLGVGDVDDPRFRRLAAYLIGRATRETYE